MNILFAVAGEFPTYFVAVYVIGFIAAVTIGSIAWYNSKRPAGWENAERPDFVPEMSAEEQSTDKEPSSEAWVIYLINQNWKSERISQPNRLIIKKQGTIN